MKRSQNPSFVTSIQENFLLPGKSPTLQPIGNGHINHTYLLTLKPSEHQRNILQQRYILQRINHHVFTNPTQLQANIALVLNHIKRKTVDLPTKSSLQKQLRLYPTRDQQYLFKDAQGDYWRVYNYIEDSHCYELPQYETQVYEAGKIIGKFQQILADLPVEQITTTISDFHHLPFRLDNFHRVVSADPVQLVQQAQSEIAFVREHQDKMLRIPTAAVQNQIPFRVTHNDTKFNNILFDNSNKAICLVDLDTIMPGLVHYDYGDALRVIMNPVDEDDVHLDQIHLNLSYFAAFTRGYLHHAQHFLSVAELKLLPESPALMAFMLGVRFLTDYLEGDRYFPASFPTQNLQRARVQFEVVRQLFTQQSEIESIFQAATPWNVH